MVFPEQVREAISRRSFGLEPLPARVVHRISARSFRAPAYVVSILLVVFIAAEWVWWLFEHASVLSNEIGIDYRIYIDAATRWLSGDSFYPAYQLAGPYDLAPPAVLYPPTILPLLVVFTAAPAILWWSVPIAITVACIALLRPAPWSWPLMLGGLAWGQSLLALVHGTPTIWIVAAVALATHWRWAGVLVLVKPSVAPFAAFGIRSPGWWIAATAMLVGALVVLPLWVDWFTVLRNATGPHATLLYSLTDAPMLAIPVWAWLARRDRTAYERQAEATAPWAERPQREVVRRGAID